MSVHHAAVPLGISRSCQKLMGSADAATSLQCTNGIRPSENQGMIHFLPLKTEKACDLCSEVLGVWMLQ